jgi:hypothetical protein
MKEVFIDSNIIFIYENFLIVLKLDPSSLRQLFCNIVDEMQKLLSMKSLLIQLEENWLNDSERRKTLK